MALHPARQADADGCCRIALSAQNAAFSTTFVLPGRVRHGEVAAVYAAPAFSACAQWRRPRYASIREAGKCDTNRCKPVDRKPCTVRSRFRSGTCECSTRSSAPCASDARLRHLGLCRARNLSVVMRLGPQPRFFSNRVGRRLAALALRAAGRSRRAHRMRSRYPSARLVGITCCG